MKRTITFALLLGMAMIFVPVAEARASAASSVSSEQLWENQDRRGRYDRRQDRRRSGRYDRRDDRRYGRYDRRDNRRYDRGYNRGRAYSYTTTRYVRRWGRTYREYIRVTRLPNGRTKTHVIRRVRVR